jgi:beta-lactamase class A
MWSKPKIPYLMLALLIFIVSFLLGVLSERIGVFTHNTGLAGHAKQIREDAAMGTSTGERLVNPLLECEVAEGMIDAYKENFQDELEIVVDDLKTNGDVSTVAVYFRDLNNGPTFGINEDEKFVPASLLKVPVMMSYYKLAEDEPDILDRKLTYEKESNLAPDGSQLIAPSKEIEVGKKYPISELIERTISYSDNEAVTLLIYNMPSGPIRTLYHMLGVSDGVLNGPEGRLTVKEYAAFFRILFNSSYLSQKYSTRALLLLTKTEFDQGLKAGVPSDVVVAHKFGEGGDVSQHQIHDCGIVYYPGHPYLLCIMSSGGDIKKLEGAITKISAFIYKKIDTLQGTTKGE